MHMVRRVLDTVVTILAWLAGIATTLMMLHVALDVALRNIFNAPLTGTVEIASSYYMVALSFLPLALITRERGHVIVELFTGWMKLRARTILDGLVAIITLVYVCVFTWKAIEVAIDKFHIREAREAGTGFIEIWPSRWLVVAGFGLMAIYVAIYMVKDIYNGLTDNLDHGDDDRHGGDGGHHVNPTEGQL